jgi:signal transduction histidine kinase
MRIRMLVAAITLLVLSNHRLTVVAFLLLLSVAALSWLAASNWEVIVPWLLAHPILMALDICVSFAVLGIGGSSGPYFLSTVVTAAVAGLLYRWPGMVAVSCVQIVFFYTTLALTAGHDAAATTFQSVVGQPVYYPLVGFAGVALRGLLDGREAEEVARRRAEAVAVAAEERARLAREMHDSLAKTLRGIALSATALPAWARRDPARVLVEAERIAAATEIASREARTLITGLRDDAVTLPLPEAVRDAVDEWGGQHGFDIGCEVDAQADLPLRARYEAMAILAETLTNIERHAEARSVSVRLVAEGADAVLTVCDDGKGFQLEELAALARAGHYGLVGLHERAQRVGGTVVVESQPGSGATVTVRLPLEGPADSPLAEVS